jgi:hypothetical protein
MKAKKSVMGLRRQTKTEKEKVRGKILASRRALVQKTAATPKGKTKKAGAAKAEPIPDHALQPMEMGNAHAHVEPCAWLGQQHKKSSVDEKTAKPGAFSEHGPKTVAGNRIRQCLLAQELKIWCARNMFGASGG